MSWIETKTDSKKIVDLSQFCAISYVKEETEYNLYGYFPTGDYDLIWSEPTKEKIEIIFTRIKSILKVYLKSQLTLGMEER